MLGDIYTGIFNFNGTYLVTPSCATGDCTWDNASKDVATYASLGTCGRCEDATASLQKSCATHEVATNTYDQNNDPVNVTSPYCNYTLPNGLSIAGTAVFPSLPLLNATGETENTTQFRHIGSPFSILSIIRADWTNRYPNGTGTNNSFDGDLTASYLRDASATQCALYHCVRLYNATVVNGTFRESVLEVHQNDTGSRVAKTAAEFAPTFDNYTLVIPTSWQLPAKAVRKFEVTPYGWQASYKQFQKIWLGNATAQSTSSLNQLTAYSSDVMQTLSRLNDSGLAHTIDNIAQSMTNNIRKSSSQVSQGTAFQSLPYVAVVWGWIALPAFLLCIAVVLLATTILRTKVGGTKLWKTSSLAAFYHPLIEADRLHVGRASGNRHLEKIAEDVHVKWAKTGKGWRLIPVEGAEGCKKGV